MKHLSSLFFFILCYFIILSYSQDILPACNSIIYCNNDVLSVFQLSGIFNDSKTFVDLPLKYPANEVYSAFLSLPSNPTTLELLSFLYEYFGIVGSDIESWIPEDWQSNPETLTSIIDNELYNWSISLNNIWKELGRKSITDVSLNPSQYSFIGMDNGFIVPGGRFREFYYWDTYWIINGLLSCDMFDSVYGTLQNFVSLLNQFGFIPNGSRVYYTKRSQPPLFTQMVWKFYQAAKKSQNYNETEILTTFISSLDKEYQYWMNNHSVDISINSETYTLNRYYAYSNLPRPEGYTEDIQTAMDAGITNILNPQQIYQDLASGAETGWDFSSRWFSDYYNQSTIKTTDIIPVDLNAILYKNEITLYNIHTLLSNTDTANTYLQAAQNRKNAFENILWNDNSGIWIDYNITSKSQRSSLSSKFYSSSFVPLWANLYWDGLTTGIYSSSYIENKFLQAIETIGMLNYIGGLPTSLQDTSQQWDFPNGWSPLQLFAIQGLQNLGHTGQTYAANLTSKWLQNNYNGWNSTQQMFEKYNVTSTLGIPGSGGEYTVQAGFGWTNGAIFELLLTYCTTNSCINNGNIQVQPILSNK